MSQDPDRELVSRCQVLGSQGFEDAFNALYIKYKDRVYSIALRVTGNGDDALDAAQEAFVLVYKHLPSFKFESKFSSWLYRLVVNASIDLLRRQRSRLRRSESLDAEGSLAASISDEAVADPGQALEAKELGRRVHESILRLSPKLRVVTVLRYLQNLSYEDVAETLEISLGTVKSRLSRAHIALAEQLRPVLQPCPAADHRPAADHQSTDGDSTLLTDRSSSAAAPRSARAAERPAERTQTDGNPTA